MIKVLLNKKDKSISYEEFLTNIDRFCNRLIVARIGEFEELSSWNILATIEHNQYSFISLKDGNRYTDTQTTREDLFKKCKIHELYVCESYEELANILLKEKERK